MKFKFPKKITIGSTTFNMIYDKKKGGGSFRYAEGKEEAKIIIGMENHKGNPLMFLEILIHELKEIIQVEQCSRVYHSGNDSFIFHYNHAHHTDFCGRLAGLLTHFIK